MVALSRWTPWGAIVFAALMGCFSSDAKRLPEGVEPTVVMGDAPWVLGTRPTTGRAVALRLEEGRWTEDSPDANGRFLAATATTSGLSALVGQVGQAAAQLWHYRDGSWHTGAMLGHGPYTQLVLADDGSLWTEGDRGVHRMDPASGEWNRAALPADLRLGLQKLGAAEGRVAFAGQQLWVAPAGGEPWTVLVATPMQATDGRWCLAMDGDRRLRLGRIEAEGVRWTGELAGNWQVSALASDAEGIRAVATRALSTEVMLIESNADGSVLRSKRLAATPGHVGLGPQARYVDNRGRIVPLAGR